MPEFQQTWFSFATASHRTSRHQAMGKGQCIFLVWHPHFVGLSPYHTPLFLPHLCGFRVLCVIGLPHIDVNITHEGVHPLSALLRFVRSENVKFRSWWDFSLDDVWPRGSHIRGFLLSLSHLSLSRHLDALSRDVALLPFLGLGRRLNGHPRWLKEGM